MINYLLIVGSVASDQYEDVRLMHMRRRIKTVTRRISSDEWEAVEQIAIDVALAYKLAKEEVKALLRSMYMPLAAGSDLYVSVPTLLDSDFYGITEEVVGRLLSKPTATIKAIVIEEKLWVDPATEIWKSELPTCSWYVLHPNGWLESA